MHSIWKGSISFGLVNIPIALYSATRREELRFRLLRASDLSPVNYKRIAEADGKEVPWDKIVKGYEYEKGKFVVLREEDFKRVDLEATQTVDIVDFVKVDEIDPVFFAKPYYMVPSKGGEKAYVLLRETLREKELVGIAKVVIKTRQHLAAIEPRKEALVLELMHFPEEIVGSEEFKLPQNVAVGKEEREMGRQLVAGMTSSWDPTKYRDDYRAALLQVIHKKIRSGGKDLPAKEPRKLPANVVDLVAVLRESIERSRPGGRLKTAGKARKSEKNKKRAARRASA